MPLSSHEAQSLMQEGVEALRQGRSADARLRFEKLTESGTASAVSWLLLAIARRADGDVDGEDAALDRHLAAGAERPGEA